MIPSSVDRKVIDALIWGNVDSEFIEARFPLSISGELSKMTKDLVWELFVGFLYFVHYKCGLVPKLSGHEKADFDSEGGDFADRSSWVDLMTCVDPIRGPYSFRQFTGKNGDKKAVCILLDTFSLFECGKILNETQLEGELKFSFPEVSKEFNITCRWLPEMLLYLKNLNDVKWAHSHTLILRPSKLAEYLYTLDAELESLQHYPEKIARKEEWEKMSIVEQFYVGKTRVTLRNNFAD